MSPKVVAVGGPGCPELSWDRGGRSALEHVCRPFGYDVVAHRVSNLNELRRTMKFIGHVGRAKTITGDPLFVHVSVDGNSPGLEVGPDRAKWEQLTLMISDMLRDLESYSRPVILALSPRGARLQHLTGMLLEHSQSSVAMPDHLFLFVAKAPRQTDAILAWAHFYAGLTDIDFTAGSAVDGHRVRHLRSRLELLGFGAPRYLPWGLTRGFVAADGNTRKTLTGAVRGCRKQYKQYGK